MNRDSIIRAIMIVLVLAVVAVQVVAFAGSVPSWLKTTAQITGVAVVCAFMLYSASKSNGRR